VTLISFLYINFLLQSKIGWISPIFILQTKYVCKGVRYKMYWRSNQYGK
jgi:hypothetical protein